MIDKLEIVLHVGKLRAPWPLKNFRLSIPHGSLLSNATFIEDQGFAVTANLFVEDAATLRQMARTFDEAAAALELSEVAA